MATPIKAGSKSPTKRNGDKETPKASLPKGASAKPAEPAPEKQTPKYVAQQANRKRFAFGPVWNANVLEGKVKDKIKLVAQADAMGLGTTKDLANKELKELIEMVAAALRDAEEQTNQGAHH
ncbi:hypothetical protein [Acinetobacter sp.]|uniref:hypothetical protein n=1 Tax=Acinetobacter sp. TaxID=472 RepID=UPI00388D9065